MSEGSGDLGLHLLQPELLVESELIEHLTVRCPHLKNLRSKSKDQLVKLFRQVVLPLPQRSYRPNRRGQMLTQRRIGAGLAVVEGVGGSAELSEGVGHRTDHARPSITDRLKPPPTISASKKIRLSSSQSHDEKTHNDKSVIKTQVETNPCKKVVLKRPGSHGEKPVPDSGQKKTRMAIKWP